MKPKLKLNLLLQIKQRISHYTNEFYNLVRRLKEKEEANQEFFERNVIYAEADSMKKLRWFLALFIVTPILILVDYASVYLFIAALAERLPEGIGRSVIYAFSIVIFFILELATILAILKIDEILETHSNAGLSLLKYVLMLIMISSPALLIYVGYTMEPVHSPGAGLKTFVLMIVSLTIHLIFFIIMEDILNAINYIKYKISAFFSRLNDIKPRLERLKEKLRTDYIKYDIEYINFSLDPDSTVYLSKVELSKREKFLKERLEDDIDDNDYDEFIDSKRYTPPKPVGSGVSKPGSSASSPTTTTIW
ncbi:MAG: hypothetical protein K9I69_03235 [Ignavibacteriales bacterium]|nr:hypothetical protein [Ignavibacteriales bacterium]MCF8306316.1 hypothetical protein [Ignavibacteriales bacterium]MCF8316037.1 hypothetical protein [Ignavibacteriales bacterium]MCF8437631.1 hypothetical protein [Ignavibacteriales bacterium]